MGKRYKVLCLNGPNKGKEVKVEASYTAEEEQLKKNRLKLEADGIKYAGYCRRCGTLVREEESSYITNVDGVGNLLIDVYHKYCL